MGHGLSEGLLEAVGAVAGGHPEGLAPTVRGESGTTFVFELGPESFVLKIGPGSTESLANQERLVGLVNGLRRRGYPAPEYLGAGRFGETVFTVQRRMPGTTLEPGPGEAPEAETFESVLDDLLAAVELQAGAGDLDAAPWPDWLLDTIEKGGDGYCLHQTMLLRSDTVHLLRRIQAVARRGATGAVRSDDVMHFDLNPANILHLDGKLTAVVDWNVPFTGSSQGDRGFDLATLLFYSYDLSTTRELIWQRLIEVSGAGWASVYLAHLCLRQVEWSLRHRPGSAELTRFLQIAVGVMERFGPSLPL